MTLASSLPEWKYEVYNPHNKKWNELPWIIGFNNGGSEGLWHGQLIDERGTPLGSHICSHEGYMRADLGVLKGSRPDRHETFKENFPDGYRMDFVSFDDVNDDPRLQKAFKLYDERKPEAKGSTAKIEITIGE